jgi:hypothetical protein
MKNMKNFYKLFFLINCLFFPIYNLKANASSSMADIMGKRVENVKGEAGISGGQSAPQIIGYGIQIVLSLLAVIFLILVVIAGFKWMTAGGNQETISKTQKSLKEAIIGLLIVLSAYAITWFIFEQLKIEGISMPPAG